MIHHIADKRYRYHIINTRCINYNCKHKIFKLIISNTTDKLTTAKKILKKRILDLKNKRTIE